MGFILRSAKTYQDWSKDLMDQLKITTNDRSMKWLGIKRTSLVSHAAGKCMPSIKTIIILSKTLASETGESSQDILDCIFESIPEWTDHD
tara:strand:- start:1377 stop:1646 length:270 start_codon:yes stop_codon:yes gene_type:complete